MEQINRDNLYEITREMVPELSSDVYEDAGYVYPLFGNLAIFLGEALRKNTLDQLRIENIFQLLNAMAEHPDLEIQNIFEAGFLEVITNYEDIMEVVTQHLSERANSILKENLRRWGIE